MSGVATLRWLMWIAAVIGLVGCGSSDKQDGVDVTDSDSDGYASELSGGTDCDDGDAAVNPGAEEVPYNGIDDDCKRSTPDDDLDWDAFSAAEAGGPDCDDADAAVNPRAEEVPYNGIDDDCDEATRDDDLDEDGFGAVEVGGTDCDDGDATVNPGAEDVCRDGKDNDCDGSEVESLAECGMGGDMGLSVADLKLVGEEPNDQAGYALSGAGDLDGDGLDDLLVGAILADSGGANAGAAYVLRGGAALVGASGERSLSGADLKLMGEAASDLAAYSVSRGGDVDGDGLDDLIIGAFGEDGGGEDAGAAYVLLGGGALAGASGASTLAIADLKLKGETDEDHVGDAVSGAGDIDGDGLDDLVVGAPGEDGGGEDAGAAYVLLGGGALAGASGASTLAVADLKLTGEADHDDVGDAVSGAGDIDGDGLDDLVVGCGYSAEGAHLLLGGGALADAFGVQSLSDADLMVRGDGPYDCAGCAVSGAGDVDGDGLDDLLIGAPRWERIEYDYEDDKYYRSETDGAGAAYLLLGGGSLEGASGVLSLAGAELMLVGAENDYAGRSVSGVGDWDGDGLGDLLVGSEEAAEAFLLLGGGVLAGASGVELLSIADLTFTGESGSDSAGWSVSGAGDVNDDGFDDLLVGDPVGNHSADDPGAAYLVFGGAY